MKRFLLFLACLAGTFLVPHIAQAQSLGTVCIYVEQNGTTRNCTGVVKSPNSVATLTNPTSNTITTGGTSQQAYAANTARTYLMCQNPPDATEPLYINTGAAAASNNGSIILAPGGSWTLNADGIYTGTINVVAATTGHYYVCKQG